MSLKDKEAHRAYCRAYYYAHGGKNRQRKPRLTREERLARKRARSAEYRKRNAEKIRAYKKRPEVRERRKAENRRWREKNRDYARAYYAAHKDAFREYHLRWLEKWGAAHGVTPREPLTDEERLARRRASRRKWNAANRERVRDATRAWKEHNPDRVKAYRIRCIVREMTDCEYYAERRRKDRERANRRRLRMGLSAVGKPARRIPDWCVRVGYWTRAPNGYSATPRTSRRHTRGNLRLNANNGEWTTNGGWQDEQVNEIQAEARTAQVVHFRWNQDAEPTQYVPRPQAH